MHRCKVHLARCGLILRACCAVRLAITAVSSHVGAHG
jgi:hypothetical protein